MSVLHDRRPWCAAWICAAALMGACSGSVPSAPTAPAPATPQPEISFTLSGTVFDTIGRPVGQANIAAINGPQAGTAAQTDDQGRYAFDRPFTANFTLQVSKPGYITQSKLVTSGQLPAYFRLDSITAPSSLPPTFHLTFAADAACTELPAAVRTRTYTASGGNSSGYVMDLRGATFGVGDGSYIWHTIYANVFEDMATLYFQDPPIWEQLTPEQWVVIYGLKASGSIRDLPVTMPFAGSFTFCAETEADVYPECEVPEIVCRSEHHTLTLSR